ncbi:MAG: flavin reductase family protein [Afipia felis]|nr:flavin reductase family protein [Afipia felis]
MLANQTAIASQKNFSPMIDHAPIMPDQFKAVMRRFAASVNVITSADSDVLNGMTATAVCSVTTEPPSVLIIVNRANRSHPIIKNSQAFAVNVLSEEQKGLAQHFASRANDPFASVEHFIGKTGCPIIKGADAFLECVVTQETEVGSHTIFVGQVVASETFDERPLLYHAGQYLCLKDAKGAA